MEAVAPFLSLLLLSVLHVSLAPAAASTSTYIVHMASQQKPAGFEEHSDWYHSALESVSPSAEMLYNYDTVLHGFSARLTAEEAQSLGAQPGVLSVLPETKYELHTTRSPEFLGLDKIVDSFAHLDYEMADVIVGVVDTGIWPESKSFDDTGLSRVPARWKGACEAGTNFTAAHCNRKLIGARFFAKGYEAYFGRSVNESQEYRSPRDGNGHGTHTASTAAGSSVRGANLFRYARGRARGMCTHARVAAYKVCWLGGCFGSDILKAMDKAVKDGVNVLSLSLGGDRVEYDRDVIAIGAFAAMEKGIFVSCSAGNGGPIADTLTNVAPWITTVGAGTLDRDFPANVNLGNGLKIRGVSLYEGETPIIPLPIVYAGNASKDWNGRFCLRRTLIGRKVAGKIVVCDRGFNARVQKGVVVMKAGGLGMVLANTAADGEGVVADAHLLPATAIRRTDAEVVKKYLSSDPNATALLDFEGTELGTMPAPVVAGFSSRGPNSLTPAILKPDLIAPGVNILAAWSRKVAPTGLDEDPRRVNFNIISGTSMSCPHVSGLAALIKSVHPDWSPAAVRSALMTTAYASYKNGGKMLDSATGLEATPFGYGAGHVDPCKALDPGLVYDLTAEDYLGFLCALNYNETQIHMVARRCCFPCHPEGKNYTLAGFNYPSFAVPFAAAPTALTYTRTLTNVGAPGTYNVKVTSDARAVKVTVAPETLTFSEKESKSYMVTFEAVSRPRSNASFGWMKWTDGKHIVTSPLAFSWT